MRRRPLSSSLEPPRRAADHTVKKEMLKNISRARPTFIQSTYQALIIILVYSFNIHLYLYSGVYYIFTTSGSGRMRRNLPTCYFIPFFYIPFYTFSLLFSRCNNIILVGFFLSFSIQLTSGRQVPSLFALHFIITSYNATMCKDIQYTTF